MRSAWNMAIVDGVVEFEDGVDCAGKKSAVQILLLNHDVLTPS